MAKKKKQKEEKKKNSGYYIELVGLLLIVLAIIGYGQFGIAGNLIVSFAAFLTGAWYNVLLLIVAIIGGYMIVKRSTPNFFTIKLVGLYLIILGLLIHSHTGYITEHKYEGFAIIKETVNNFLSASTYIGNIAGGGIIGALFSSLFVQLFDIGGTIIIVWAFYICGGVMFTGVTISDIIAGTTGKVKNIWSFFRRNKSVEPDVQKIEEDYEKDNKIIVSSVDELIQVHEEKDEVKEPENESEESVIEVLDIDEEINSKGYLLPSLDLLENIQKSKDSESKETIKENAAILNQVFEDFGLEGKVVAANIGPSVTQYEMEIKAGTKVSRILSIHREIALALAARDVRIQAPIPGKRTIGVEIPNKVTSMVGVREILSTIPRSMDSHPLLVVLGKDIVNRPIHFEINKTPHLLVAGATGSGKSVCINSIIISILMRSRPDEVKLLLVDPKKVELSMYNGVPHLMTPVVTDPKKANIALKKLVSEMERRYEIFSESGTKNIAGYNAYLENKNKKLGPNDQIKPLPYIVAIIDELADLMLVAAKEVEDSIMRITQMARAAGIHLIVATQRPSTDVITGVVKANIPSRISFAVSSSIDSRTILDMTGAEKLLGKGDMLFLPQGESTPIRVQGTFISEEEIKRVVDHTISQQKARYDETLLMDEEEKNATSMLEDEDYEDPLYRDIVEFVMEEGKASASRLQRRFKIGYNRAARVIDLLEERGIIGPSQGSKPREVLVRLESNDE